MEERQTTPQELEDYEMVQGTTDNQVLLVDWHERIRAIAERRAAESSCFGGE